MKKLLIALCLSMLTVAAFAARGPVEIKADIQKAKAAVKAAKATHSDATTAKTNLVALERELSALTPSRASHLDDGGETCDVATLIDVVPFFDGGVIDEFTSDDYMIDTTDNYCGSEGADLVYRIIVGENGIAPGVYAVNTCGSDFDTVIELWDSCPDSENRQLVACNDDIEEENEGDLCNDENSGLSSCIPFVELSPGTYYLVVFGYSFDTGDYSLSFNNIGDCGDGLLEGDCSAEAENSWCPWAEQIALEEGSAYVLASSTLGAFHPYPEYCGTDPEACGLWYEVIGTGNTMRAHTCSDQTNYDTKINVYTGTCEDAVCVDGNDDWYYYDEDLGEYISGCPDYDLASYVEWCSVEGQSYFIFVNGYDGETGRFGLTIEDSGEPCEPPCYEEDYYFTVEQVPFCQCLTICPGQIQKIFVGPASEYQRPIATWSDGCALVADNIPPSGCESECYPAYPELYMDWIYLPEMQLWCMDLYSDQGGCYCFCVDQVLPVELNGFTAVASDGEVALAWSTASEANVERFEIVRDGTTLAQIPAANSATGAHYNWTDVTVVNGTTYSYELVLVNLDGSRQNIATQSATPTLGSGVVTEFALMQNYPNPFNPETSIAFSVPEVSNVELRVFNAIGQEVAVLANGSFSAGNHIVKFSGEGLSSGLYFYTLKAGSFSAQHKMLLLK